MQDRVNISRDQLTRALRVYWHFAWPPSSLCPVLPDWGDLGVNGILKRFHDETANHPNACRRFVLRLGNHLYPHMKFAVEQCTPGGDFYFLADCHDAARAPGAIDQSQWDVLRGRNLEIKLAIEAAWDADGLPTFRHARHAAAASYASPGHAGVGGCRILIVDDEPANAELTGAVLRAEGFGTVTSPSGSDALGCVRSVKPDLIVSDYEMPGLTGRDVALQLKADKDTREIPVLICTYADVTVEDLRPADALLKRPFSPQQLRQQVDLLLKGKARHD